MASGSQEPKSPEPTSDRVYWDISADLRALLPGPTVRKKRDTTAAGIQSPSKVVASPAPVRRSSADAASADKVAGSRRPLRLPKRSKTRTSSSAMLNLPQSSGSSQSTELQSVEEVPADPSAIDELARRLLKKTGLPAAGAASSGPSRVALSDKTKSLNVLGAHKGGSKLNAGSKRWGPSPMLHSGSRDETLSVEETPRVRHEACLSREAGNAVPMGNSFKSAKMTQDRLAVPERISITLPSPDRTAIASPCTDRHVRPGLFQAYPPSRNDTVPTRVLPPNPLSDPFAARGSQHAAADGGTIEEDAELMAALGELKAAKQKAVARRRATLQEVTEAKDQNDSAASVSRSEPSPALPGMAHGAPSSVNDQQRSADTPPLTRITSKDNVQPGGGPTKTRVVPLGVMRPRTRASLSSAITGNAPASPKSAARVINESQAITPGVMRSPAVRRGAGGFRPPTFVSTPSSVPTSTSVGSSAAKSARPTPEEGRAYHPSHPMYAKTVGAQYLMRSAPTTAAPKPTLTAGQTSADMGPKCERGPRPRGHSENDKIKASHTVRTANGDEVNVDALLEGLREEDLGAWTDDDDP